MSRPEQPVASRKLDLLKVAALTALRTDHDRCNQAAAKTYQQHLSESQARNQRIFERYGALVYISEFDRLYGKEARL